LTCKPFKQDHDEQIKLVTSFDWLDFSALDGIEDDVRDIFRGSLFVDEARCHAICQALRGRIERLQKIARSQNLLGWVDDQSTDVKENIAYSGLQE
ncbi:excisionase, partial [Escherichia coli]|nr:excisionase [Escherichia coli]